ncbi:ABC transporter ATP-binding protein [Paenibacillus fonticola]|uniref:ABC transporter ATP-binding protein n=1 Tax=Paenibacillus fonticola TaxID=379896 RepID=UPI00037ABD0A|nr:ABC transporter ATP-binding protein [Paenibacillus fonticola]
MHVKIQHVSKTYASGGGYAVKALDNISLTIENSEFVCLLGPSGCGKSTLLKLIAGIESSSSGSVQVGGAHMSGPSPERGFVFQEHALFPWLNVRDNISFGLDMKRLDRKTKKNTVNDYLRLLGLEKAARLYPKQLSGGMSQRVAIARALCLNPRLLLLDEPFAALDAILRQKMQEEMVRIWRRENKSFILVTHDVEEAIYLADRIIIMTPGPGTIKDNIPVSLPRPRIRTEAGFIQLRGKILRLLQSDEPETGDLLPLACITNERLKPVLN